MRSARFAAVVCLTLVVCSFPTMAQAQLRTWVSGVGNDADPCSRTLPCKTFAGAIGKTTAPGEIDTMDPGGFGAVTIVKSMTIDASSGLGGILAAGVTGVTVSAAGTDVVILRNLDINGTGTGTTGIHITGAGDVRIEHCKIYGFNGRGIQDDRTSGHLAIVDTVVSNNAQTGIVALPGAASTLSISLDRVQMHSNGNAGLAVTNGAQAMVTRSTSSSNVIGFYADTNAVINVDDSFAFANSGSGINSQTGATIRLFSTTVTGNATGLSVAGGSILSYTPATNRIVGNAAGNGPPTGTIMLQ